MKRVGWISGLIALALAMLAAGSPAVAQVDNAKAVSVCGTPGNTPVTGNVYPMTADLTGALCIAGSFSLTPSGTQDVNLKQVGATTVLTGAGATGAGSQRTTVAQDTTTLAGSPTTTILQQGTKQSGVSQTAVIGCDLHAFYDASDNGKKTVVAGVSAKKIYVCGYVLATGGTATNLSLTSGTGSDCVSTSTAITPAYQLVANDRVGANAGVWNGLITLANADNLCVNASAGNAHQVEVWYTIQ